MARRKKGTVSVSSGRTKAFETGWRPRSTTSRRTPPHKRQLYSVKSIPYLACQQVGEKPRRLLRTSNAFREVPRPGTSGRDRSRNAIRNPARSDVTVPLRRGRSCRTESPQEEAPRTGRRRHARRRSRVIWRRHRGVRTVDNRGEPTPATSARFRRLPPADSAFQDVGGFGDAFAGGCHPSRKGLRAGDVLRGEDASKVGH